MSALPSSSQSSSSFTADGTKETNQTHETKQTKRTNKLAKCVSWYLVRHAPVLNPDALAYGALDLPIDDSQVSQNRIDYLRAILPNNGQVRTSALKRTIQTLNAVWPGRTAPIDARWNEQCLGAWEGQPMSRIYHDQGPARQLIANPDHFRPPDHNDGAMLGESCQDVRTRVTSSLCAANNGQKLSREPQNLTQTPGLDTDNTHVEADHHQEHQIVFSHAGPIRATIAQALNINAQTSFGFVIDPLSLTRLDCVHFFDDRQWQQQWRIGGVNLGPAF